MDNSRKQKANVADAANNLLNEGKKWVHEMRDEGLHKVNQAEEQVKVQSDQILKKIQENPLSSVLIAGGIGFILSRILRK